MTGTPCRHQVQFYGPDDALGPNVSDVLAVPLLRGEAALVVAGPGHRVDFAAALIASGVDLAAARRAGRYLELDAASTLTALLGPRGVTREGFHAVIGARVEDAARRFGAVSVYGELVGLLTEQDPLTAALEVEIRWSELMHRQRFRLLCGYPRGCFTTADDRAARARICAAHDAVLPGATASRAVDLPAGPRAAARARRATREVCSAWGLDDPTWLDDAELVVAELVGNGVRHTRSMVTLALALRGGRVTVSVADGVDAVPEPRVSPPLAENGRGFAIIDVLADGWGVEPQSRGKRVWVRLRPSPSDDLTIELRDGVAAHR